MNNNVIYFKICYWHYSRIYLHWCFCNFWKHWICFLICYNFRHLILNYFLKKKCWKCASNDIFPLIPYSIASIFINIIDRIIYWCTFTLNKNNTVSGKKTKVYVGVYLLTYHFQHLSPFYSHLSSGVTFSSAWRTLL